METFKKVLRKSIFIISAVLAGLCLFLILSAFNINRTVLSSSFHKQLFDKHEIYKHTHNVISSSMSQYIDSLKKDSPDNFTQHTAVFSMLEKAVTPEMIKLNLDSIREGIFGYVKGERKFLPDIYINDPKTDQASTSKDNNNITSEAESSIATQALSKIQKINLSAVLLYINRSDISDSLFELKFINFLLSQTPVFLTLILLLLLLIGLYTCIKVSSGVKWISLFSVVCGMLSIASGLGLLFYSYSIMPKSIYPVVMSLPLQSNAVISYIHDCISPVTVSLLVCGIFFVILAVIVFYFPHLLPLLLRRNRIPVKEKNSDSRTQRIIKNTVFVFFSLLLLSAIFYRANIIRAGYESNDFAMAVAKMKNTNTSTQVISAKNEAVYTLYVKLVDDKTKIPVSNVEVNVSGKSSVNDKYFNLTLSTDDTGTAKFTLDKGAFRISFDTNSFPSEYQMPKAFFSELKSAGTTIITVNLEDLPEPDNKDWGIVEIEVLDAENKPVPNLELSIEGIVSAPGFPNDIFSYTNLDGIAVFKINPGSYKAVFSETKFPKEYILPSALDVTATGNSVSRYTIRLVNTRQDSKEKH